MLFIETEIFTEDVQKLLTDDEFSRFQFFLALNPDDGEVIPETGGLRKVRWVSGGKGKRAGVRVIYFHQVKHYEIRLLLIYRKGIKDDLSPQEKAMLRLLNTRW
ncbi:TPA: type II toxin-antitoxin system RelE/ParE family toxin [Escherichia coli]|nr:type II toxin-antitoxin system RelE/ParE family toxin [Escherichia coli]HBI8551820.1 type II toxin-antitoxin system RelE/ParE family toxin [Escherichia coli]HBI8559225.1 type II toxin-antitoxin system RelE/ParE family toxin [Escherichia coli]HBI8569824.1 type II toxin-antitoxin system RelE/ParE family toxin [Escherichia coli]HBI8583112.1 type II toxin-antitoxin system RelE/ParE family toxin [Escherichia coli]